MLRIILTVAMFQRQNHPAERAFIQANRPATGPRHRMRVARFTQVSLLYLSRQRHPAAVADAAREKMRLGPTGLAQHIIRSGFHTAGQTAGRIGQMHQFTGHMQDRLFLSPFGR
ncbi:hypothetical protein GCM10011498_18990 [Amylibacter cionae]|uniref:Uncharacterized protein n=1 Tax=Neptunicoccus cionae TaxID=2035344 RepID=A0A916VPX2_9RHOB|nr:hypothetical protein GCM10011498_18990 [Amylibacter cionae]